MSQKELKEGQTCLIQELETTAASERLSGNPDWQVHLMEYLTRAKAAGDVSCEQYCYSLLAEASYIKSDITSFRHYLILAAELMSEGQNKKAMSIAYNVMGIDAMNNGNVVLAIEDFRESLETAVDERQMYVAKANISNIYELIGDYAKALDQTSEIAAYYESRHSRNDQLNYMLTLVQNAEFYLKLDNLDGARRRMAQLEKLLPELSDFVRSDPVIPELYAHYQYYIGNTDEAHKYVEQYIDAMTDLDLIIDMLYDLGRFGHEMVDRGEMDYAARVIEQMTGPVKASGTLYFELLLLGLEIDYNKAAGLLEENLPLYQRFYELTQQKTREDMQIVDTHTRFREGLIAMTEKQKAMKLENVRLRQEAEMDSLTGLTNRRTWTRHAERALQAAADQQMHIAVEMLDIDYFKQVNDHYGHQTGDDYLRRVAAVLKELTDDRIRASRYGGDEFCILYWNMTEEEIRSSSQAIRQKILDQKMENAHARAQEDGILTISQGICYGIPGGKEDLSQYIMQADHALYHVKQTGRGGIRCDHKTA